MKKTALLGVSILALSTAAPALAQSQSTVNQTGNNSTVTVTQGGPDGGNSSNVDQSASDSNVTIDQEGFDDNVDGVTNTSTVTQAGLN